MIASVLLYVALGGAIGALGTLIGAGGGFLLLPILLFVLPHVPPAQLTAISLAVVAANALTGTFAYWRQGRIDVRSLVPFALASIPGALLGALATTAIPRRAFDAGFGLALTALAVWLALRPALARARTHGTAQRELTDRAGVRYAWAFDMRAGIGLSSVIGFLSSLLGIGGGVLQVPALVTLLGFPERVATATSLAILGVSALAGTAVHAAHGDFGGNGAIIAALVCGTLGGAFLGAHASQRVPAAMLLRVLSVALFSVGLRMIFAT